MLSQRSFRFLFALVPFVNSSESSTTDAGGSNFKALTKPAARALAPLGARPAAYSLNQPGYNSPGCTGFGDTLITMLWVSRVVSHLVVQCFALSLSGPAAASASGLFFRSGLLASILCHRRSCCNTGGSQAEAS